MILVLQIMYWIIVIMFLLHCAALMILGDPYFERAKRYMLQTICGASVIYLVITLETFIDQEKSKLMQEQAQQEQSE